MPKGVPGSKAPHGTRTRYQTHACRCKECLAAYRIWRRADEGRVSWAEYQASRPKARHGTETMYSGHGCRCDECTQASREARARRREKAAS